MVRTPLPNRWCVPPPSELRWHSPWKGHIPPAIADLQRLFGYVKCTFHASIFGQNMNSNPYHLAKVRLWMVAKSCTSRWWTFRYRLSTILLVVPDFAGPSTVGFFPIPQITITMRWWTHSQISVVYYCFNHIREYTIIGRIPATRSLPSPDWQWLSYGPTRWSNSDIPFIFNLFCL